MEQTLESHIRCYDALELTLLGDAQCSIPGRAIGFTGHVLRIVVDQPIALDTAVRIQAGDWMAFGEVCYCEPEMSHYAVGLELDQTVMGLAELDALRRNRLNQRTETPVPQ